MPRRLSTGIVSERLVPLSTLPGSLDAAAQIEKILRERRLAGVYVGEDADIGVMERLMVTSVSYREQQFRKAGRSRVTGPDAEAYTLRSTSNQSGGWNGKGNDLPQRPVREVERRAGDPARPQRRVRRYRVPEDPGKRVGNSEFPGSAGRRAQGPDPPGAVGQLGKDINDYNTPDALVGLLLEHPEVMTDRL